ncbi:3'-5' exoribonuclease YhaM family protein [Phycisphaerales bacterium AB-hyl4]|uniref:3'-5' exoribonuclease YhaM family protein n=1 Tax=Natronomicrosphaera hydrolytica TaxID=3242702 RepID=A0ABV4U606_9BACT
MTTTTQRIYLRDMAPAQLVQGVFAIHNCQLGMTRTGKPYLRCLVGDRTARKPARMWNATEELYNTLPTDGFVYLEGETQPYQGEMQIILRNVQAYTPTADELRDLLPCTEHDVDQMFADLVDMLGSIENPALQCLANRYLEDGELMEKFCQAPAAMSLHHAYLGGLLEHTLSVMRLADKILPLYTNLNRDIVLVGLFIHDLGKCSEQTWEQGFGYSTDGQLVGHIARGSIWLEEKARACQQLEEDPITIPAPILRVLHHIILSHHGQPEFGALKIPATPEALAVSLIDNLDAKMNMALTAARSEPTEAEAENDLGGHFTEKLWALGNTRFYRPDPTTLPAEAE